MGVVMQAASFADVAGAVAWEAQLVALRDAMISFEKADASPWSMDKVPPPLVDFAARRGKTWPRTESTRFLLKGAFADVAEILRVDRVVFFWGNGFELGGDMLAELAKHDGAIRTSSACRLRVRSASPDARAAELAAFLDDEDHAGHYILESTDAPWPEYTLFAIAFEGEGAGKSLVFDGSGMRDWAFVAALPQLDG